jgi:hypothetical protein
VTLAALVGRRTGGGGARAGRPARGHPSSGRSTEPLPPEYPDPVTFFYVVPISSGGDDEPRWKSNGRERYYRSDDKVVVVELSSTMCSLARGRAGRPERT